MVFRFLREFNDLWIFFQYWIFLWDGMEGGGGLVGGVAWVYILGVQ